jgi:hypothetical protein
VRRPVVPYKIQHFRLLKPQKRPKPLRHLTTCYVIDPEVAYGVSALGRLR